MRVALVNPPWRFEHSIYFGCRAPHLALELGYSRALLEQSGHDVLFVDAHLCALDEAEAVERIAAFKPDMTVVTSAPSYLFWRCAPPELRVPRSLLATLGTRGGMTVAVGPHGSATPETTLRKLGCDVVVRGECEEVVAEIASRGGPDGVDGVDGVDGTAFMRDGAFASVGPNRVARFTDLPPLQWPDDWISRHTHHHHRFDAEPAGPGAEIEASRGCPYHCSFCAKIDFRDGYRRRDIGPLMAELDGLIAQGVRYVYFIDEIFLPWRELLEALVARDIKFGVQTRIDLWKPEMIELLGRAGCVSIEAGVESLTEEGRDWLAKKCRMTTDELSERLILARRHVPFVQANLIATVGDDPAMIAAWREALRARGVWANDPVPLYPYPSSPDYRRLWGAPDERAWERAHAHYLAQFDRMSDIQEQEPLPLAALECECLGR